MNVFEIIILVLLSPLFLMLLLSPFYFIFSLNKWLYHDIMGWHLPRKDEMNSFDGVSLHNHCKHCGKEIMQDSQGNWFTF